MNESINLSRSSGARAHGREPAQSISVGHELLMLEHAIQGVAALVDAQRLGGIDDYDIEQGVAALMALVGTRVRDLGRLVRGSMPADFLLARHNEALDAMEGDDPDVVLPAAPPPRAKGHRRRG
jgi:hypothetical protein